MNPPDFQLIFEATPGLYAVLDREFRTVAASDAYLRATMKTREELIGRSVFDVFPANPEDPSAKGGTVIRKVLEKALREGTPQTLSPQRYDVARPDGSFEKRYWSAVVTPLAGADGAVEYLLCATEDVTDPAREARYRKLVDVDAIGIVFFDTRGTIISANDTFLRWTGYPREEVAAGELGWERLTPPEYHAVSREQLARLRATGRIGPYEKEYLTRSGARRWMLFVGAHLDDGTVVEYCLDISDRKAAEAARRESEERYQRLFESIDAGFCVIEVIFEGERPVDYRFIEVNPAFQQQTGLSNTTGRRVLEFVPDHEQHWFDLYGDVARTGEPIRFIQEAKSLRRWYDVYAFPAGGGGNHVGVLFNDITARVLAEQALKAEAQRKDEFLATLAHELRNPLAPIRNAVSLLRLRKDADDELHLVGELIERQVRHLVRLVDDLMDVSRITFGKVHLQRERLDLREVAREAVATSEPVMAAASHRLTTELGSRPVWVDADPVRLAQVISNLLNNAARYTEPGGSVTLEVGIDGSEARVAVADTGIGIEPAMLERVFEPFMQIDDGGHSGGIGIGLALAKALVQLHGGSITAHSAGTGKGSRFVVRLPLAPAAEANADDAARSAEARRRFLVVDDNVDATVIQAALLRRLGHEVETAYNGAAALEKAHTFRPHVVLLDLGMPGMDGFEVARRLRAMPEGRDVLLVAQTGWGQDEDRRRTKAAGFDAHLAKPVDVAALMRLI